MTFVRSPCNDYEYDYDYLFLQIARECPEKYSRETKAVGDPIFSMVLRIGHLGTLYQILWDMVDLGLG